MRCCNLHSAIAPSPSLSLPLCTATLHTHCAHATYVPCAARLTLTIRQSVLSSRPRSSGMRAWSRSTGQSPARCSITHNGRRSAQGRRSPKRRQRRLTQTHNQTQIGRGTSLTMSMAPRLGCARRSRRRAAQRLSIASMFRVEPQDSMRPNCGLAATASPSFMKAANSS